LEPHPSAALRLSPKQRRSHDIVGAILEAGRLLTMDEQPERLSDPSFRQELVDLLVRYVMVTDDSEVAPLPLS